MSDRFATHATSLQSPASHGFAITPNDDVDLVEVTRALFIGGGGSLAVIMASGASFTLSGIQAGSVLSLRVRRIRTTGTSASNIVGLV